MPDDKVAVLSDILPVGYMGREHVQHAQHPAGRHHRDVRMEDRATVPPHNTPPNATI